MIGIVDYGMGNLRSVYNAFDYLGENVRICSKPNQLSNVSKIVLPGVGAFKDSIEKLRDSGFEEELNLNVLIKEKPIMGICLGLQLMAKESYEGGKHTGLDWYDASVIKIRTQDKQHKVPNVGWNEINIRYKSSLYNEISDMSDFYFVHSYYMKCNNEEDIIATYEYGSTITASVLKNNIFATQFHPEKSQELGLKLIENFCKWSP